jgi:3-hydroxyisobutyrate dehydrogenase-like beta-hydroxyacid dehydrogenase
MNNTPSSDLRLGMLGFGEAAQILARSLPAIPIFAYDALVGTDRDARLRAAASEYHVTLVPSPPELAANAGVIFSLVTAATAKSATESMAPFLSERHLFVDLNSSSPAAKIANYSLLKEKKVLFVDAAVMDSVPARGIQVPIIAVGPGAKLFHAEFQRLGMNISLMDGEVGKASAYKMLRSIITKGLEGLFLEGFWAAAEYDLLDEVFATVASSIEGKTLDQIADTILVSAGKHAPRKKGEMEAALATAREAGIPGKMTEGTIAIYEELIRRRHHPAETPAFQKWRDVVAFLQEKR